MRPPDESFLQPNWGRHGIKPLSLTHRLKVLFSRIFLLNATKASWLHGSANDPARHLEDGEEGSSKPLGTGAGHLYTYIDKIETLVLVLVQSLVLLPVLVLIPVVACAEIMFSIHTLAKWKHLYLYLYRYNCYF